MKLIQPRRFHPWKTLWVLSVFVAFYWYVSLRDVQGPPNPAWQGETMGTFYSIKLADSPLSLRELKDLQQRVDRALDEVNRQMSHYRQDSEISAFNRADPETPVPVSPAFARVVRFSLDVHERSSGVFDPTLGPLIDAWGFGPPGMRISAPPESALEEARARTGCKYLRVEGNRLIKTVAGLQLNLSAVAKGYGVDETAHVIRAAGVSNVFVEIGGEVAAFGNNAGGGPWRVGIDTPDPEAMPGQNIQAVIELSGQAVATSGDYRNFFVDENGKRFSHIIDPRTGRPVEHHLASVSVIANDCMTADAFATTLLAMGEEEGMEWIESEPDAEALFIVRAPDGTFQKTLSSGFPAGR